VDCVCAFVLQMTIICVRWRGCQTHSDLYLPQSLKPSTLTLYWNIKHWMVRTLTTHDCNGLSTNVSKMKRILLLWRHSLYLYIPYSGFIHHYYSSSQNHHTHCNNFRILKWPPSWMSMNWNCFRDDHLQQQQQHNPKCEGNIECLCADSGGR